MDSDISVIFSDEFDKWLQTCDENVQDELMALIGVLRVYGVKTQYPYSSKVFGAKRYKSMRELRTKIDKRAYRVLYIFDPKRNAVLLLGGDKSGDKQWYKKSITIAEKIYDEYLLKNNI